MGPLCPNKYVVWYISRVLSNECEVCAWKAPSHALIKEGLVFLDAYAIRMKKCPSCDRDVNIILLEENYCLERYEGISYPEPYWSSRKAFRFRPKRPTAKYVSWAWENKFGFKQLHRCVLDSFGDKPVPESIRLLVED